MFRAFTLYYRIDYLAKEHIIHCQHEDGTCHKQELIKDVKTLASVHLQATILKTESNRHSLGLLKVWKMHGDRHMMKQRPSRGWLVLATLPNTSNEHLKRFQKCGIVLCLLRLLKIQECLLKPIPPYHGSMLVLQCGYHRIVVGTSLYKHISTCMECAVAQQVKPLSTHSAKRSSMYLQSPAATVLLYQSIIRCIPSRLVTCA